ncbi:MAG: phosphoribosylglycinamide formyltransferase [Bacteroides sp.]|jgi:phosphoribosylglycinamide formyltransferase-1|nr:phosphoribosylglycinamide formyltransferase [Bacteroides sp.]MCI1682252.1 phosphoribosylglycinamide formyltransferase [Bacteroides sp.]
MKKSIAVFASGNGSNAENIIRHFKKGDLAQVNLVLSNSQSAFVLTRAQALQVPYSCLSKSEWEDGTHILSMLRDYDIDFIVLAGFLARVPDCILNAYPNKIINIHPSLLPKFGGKGMYGDHVHQAVVAAGEKETGITIHYINERFDEGTVIFQATCPVAPEDTSEDVAKRVHVLEYKYYPEIIEELLLKV